MTTLTHGPNKPGFAPHFTRVVSTWPWDWPIPTRREVRPVTPSNTGTLFEFANDWHPIAEFMIEHPLEADRVLPQPSNVDKPSAPYDWHQLAETLLDGTA